MKDQDISRQKLANYYAGQMIAGGTSTDDGEACDGPGEWLWRQVEIALDARPDWITTNELP